MNDQLVSPKRPSNHFEHAEEPVKRPRRASKTLAHQESSPSQNLPLDILFVFRDYLSKNHLSGTAAQLACLSGEFYQLFIDCVDYQHLTLDADNAAKVLHMDRAFGRYFFPSNPSECRKTHLLRKCTHLTLKDAIALDTLLASSKGLGYQNRLFPNVTHLTIGEELAWGLCCSFNSPSTSQASSIALFDLHKMIKPCHLCIKYTIGEIDDIDTWAQEWDFHYPSDFFDLWAHTIKHGISQVAAILNGYWNLTSLTCHGITWQSIPTVYVRKHRLIFQPLGPTDIERGPPGSPLVLRQDRASEVADAVCLLGPPDDSTFEFIGVEHIGQQVTRGSPIAAPSTLPTLPSSLDEVEQLLVVKEESKAKGAESSDGEEEAKKEEEDRERNGTLVEEFEHLVWDNILQPEVKEVASGQVKFLTLAEASSCVCCGEL